MSKPDFDFAKYVEVPDAWIENALNIPNTAVQKPKVIRFPRRAAAAASIVLAVVLGISIFFFSGNKNPIPVAPFSSEAVTKVPAETAANSALQTEKPIESTPPDGTQKPSSVPTQPTTQPDVDSTAPTAFISAASAPVSAPETTAAPAQRATEKLRYQPTEKPQPAPTQKPAVKPTSPVRPTQKPKPTQAPATLPPTERYPGPEVPESSVIEVFAPTYFLPSEGKIDGWFYCCIYDEDGQPLGDSNLYSPSHRMEYQPNRLYYVIDRPAAPANDSEERPTYTYRIYLSNGTVMQTGTVD